MATVVGSDGVSRSINHVPRSASLRQVVVVDVHLDKHGDSKVLRMSSTSFYKICNPRSSHSYATAHTQTSVVHLRQPVEV